MTRGQHDAFQELLNKAETDDCILGFILGGSRGKGFHTEASDYDITIVVRDEVAEQYQSEFHIDAPGIDLAVLSLSKFVRYAHWKGPQHWARYDFAHVTALVDKSGEIQKLINDKASIPTEHADEYINAQLDAYLNGFFRSMKALKRGDVVGMRLEAAASISHLVNAVFALEGRMAPFPDYLTRELQRWPLQRFPWPSQRLLDALLRTLTDGNLATQQELAKTVERVFRDAGYNAVFDAWAGEDQSAMNFVV
jgi:hypothetical protein